MFKSKSESIRIVFQIAIIIPMKNTLRSDSNYLRTFNTKVQPVIRLLLFGGCPRGGGRAPWSVIPENPWLGFSKKRSRFKNKNRSRSIRIRFSITVMIVMKNFQAGSIKKSYD